MVAGSIILVLEEEGVNYLWIMNYLCCGAVLSA